MSAADAETSLRLSVSTEQRTPHSVVRHSRPDRLIANDIDPAADAPKITRVLGDLGYREAHYSTAAIFGWSRDATRRHDGGVNVSVRPAQRSDVDALGHDLAWQAAYRGVMPDGYLDGLEAADRSAMWARFIEQAPPDRRLVVIAVDDQVVGFACFGRCPDADEEGVAELFAINLDPDYWGRGLVGGSCCRSPATYQRSAPLPCCGWCQRTHGHGRFTNRPVGSMTAAAATNKYSAPKSMKCGAGLRCSSSCTRRSTTRADRVIRRLLRTPWRAAQSHGCRRSDFISSSTEQSSGAAPS